MDDLCKSRAGTNNKQLLYNIIAAATTCFILVHKLFCAKDIFFIYKHVRVYIHKYFSS